MFQISSSSPRATSTSALTVLAAMGASGMVADAQAAVFEYEPSAAVRTPNSSYNYQGPPTHWNDLLDETNWHSFGPAGGSYGPPQGFVNWNIDFASIGPITNAVFKIQKNNQSSAYGIPAGAHVNFALITEPWTTEDPEPNADPNTDRDGPDVVGEISVEAPETTSPHYWEADITSLLQIWQASPTLYHGIRFYSPDSAGGMTDPRNPDGLQVTADLALTTEVIPEPAALSIVTLGGSLLCLRRRRDRTG